VTTVHARSSRTSFARVRRARALGVVTALGVLSGSGLALADAGEAEDVRTLEKQLDDEHAALSTSDCYVACRALTSIRRAADKICALEPGPRCESAREKAEDATKRVRAACPDCAIAATPTMPAPDRAAAPSAERMSALEASEPRGGCRSCATTGGTSSGIDAGALVLATLAAVRLAGSRRSNKQDRRRL